MPQSLSNVVVHLVFSTKHRNPHLKAEVRSELFPYMTGVLKESGCRVIQTGGVEDHVHLLFAISRTVTIAQISEKIKTSSSKWIKERFRSDFSWQAGYGAFSIGSSETDAAVRYVQNQPEHHRKVTFQDEFRALCIEAGVEIDERYVWD